MLVRRNSRDVEPRKDGNACPGACLLVAKSGCLIMPHTVELWWPLCNGEPEGGDAGNPNEMLSCPWSARILALIYSLNEPLSRAIQYAEYVGAAA